MAQIAKTMKSDMEKYNAAAIKRERDCDRSYLAGLRAGWNMGVRDQDDKFDAAVANLLQEIRAAKESQ